MRKQVDGFIHRQGVHCESSALRDVFEFHGFRFSEPMIFGLGSGLGFIYWHSKQMPFPFVGGRARDFDKSLCENLGVALKVNKTSSQTKAYESLKQLIGENVPVIIHVDMPYLRYLGLPEQAHFGGHTVVVAGVDEDERLVYIADTMFKGLQKATLKELEEARSSDFKPFPPENKWLTFKFPEKLRPIEVAVRNAVEKTVQTMLYPPIKNLGVKGVDRFAAEILKWPKLFPAEDESCRQLYGVSYVMMEEDGTGGGLFRYLYSQFLKEASELIGNNELSELSQRYYQIGQKWTATAKLVRDMPKDPANAHQASEILRQIAREEAEVLSSLARVFHVNPRP